MQPEDYQIADEAAVTTMLASASLASDLNAAFDWQGFFNDYDDADTNLTEPSVPPTLPRAGAPWRLDYRRPPERYLDGGVGGRFGIIDIHITIQPNLIAADTPRSKCLAAAQDIKTRLLEQATATQQIEAEIPLVAIADSRAGWRRYRQMIGVFFGN